MLPGKSTSRSVELTVLAGFLLLLGFLFFNAAPEQLLQTVTMRSPKAPASKEEAPSKQSEEKAEAKPPAVPALDDFGLEKSAFRVEQQRVRKHQTFADMLTDEGVSYQRAVKLAEAARPTFDVRDLRTGRPYRVYRRGGAVQHVVYEQSPVRFVDFRLSDSLTVRSGERPITTVERTASGTIEHSLYEALDGAGADPSLASALSKVFAWEVDFYRVQPGDGFKVIYEEKQVDGNTIGTGRIVGARFDHRDTTYYGLYFKRGDQEGYFDEKAGSLEKALLQAPVEFAHISSGFQKRRYHPVLHEWRAHKGTDYAADAGTPVYSVGDGRVIRARYGKYNGYNVKIRHNKTYTTQYLHFSKFAEGIEPGARVKQEQVIGYVGSTGLATGPHVHYILYKNGQEVDPYDQELPSAEPVKPENRAAYARLKRRLLPRLRSGGQEAPSYASAAPSTTPRAPTSGPGR